MIKYAKTAFFTAACVLPGLAQADAKIYGKLHASADLVDVGAGRHAAVSSNSSTLGLKGGEELSRDWSAVWKLESTVDISGEHNTEGTTGLKARNRYVGLSSKTLGAVVAGYHDTPFKTLGAKVDVWAYTIGDRRAILGSGNGVNKFDVRAKNAVMYVSPAGEGWSTRLLVSAGEDSNTDGSDTNRIVSGSLIYRFGGILVGAAYESRQNFKQHGKATGARGLVKISIGKGSLSGIVEDLRADAVDNDVWQRNAYGFSVDVPLGYLHVKGQGFAVNNYRNAKKTAATMVAVGGAYHLSKRTEMYAMYAGTINQDNAMYSIAGYGHGDSYLPSKVGLRVSGASMGLIHKF